jgi:uncharacterized protein (TIGR03067 family)
MCRAICIVLVGLLWAAAACSDDPANGAAKKDLQQFQGSWQAVFVQNVDGQRATQEDIQATRLEVQGNEFTFTAKDLTVSGTFVIDPSQTPKRIDVVLKGAKPADKLLGVYQIDGDVRRSCFAFPRQARPVDVRPSEKGYFILEWKRLPVPAGFSAAYDAVTARQMR